MTSNYNIIKMITFLQHNCQYSQNSYNFLIFHLFIIINFNLQIQNVYAFNLFPNSLITKLHISIFHPYFYTQIYFFYTLKIFQKFLFFEIVYFFFFFNSLKNLPEKILYCKLYVMQMKVIFGVQRIILDLDKCVLDHCTGESDL